jgi:hypothetical protein
MSDVNFDENNFGLANSRLSQQKKPPIVHLLMKMGIAKSESAANIILLSIAVLALIATIIIVKIYIFPSAPATRIPIGAFPGASGAIIPQSH